VRGIVPSSKKEGTQRQGTSPRRERGGVLGDVVLCSSLKGQRGRPPDAK
jgi:hypothetical protein